MIRNTVGVRHEMKIMIASQSYLEMFVQIGETKVIALTRNNDLTLFATRRTMSLINALRGGGGGGATDWSGCWINLVNHRQQ